MSLIKLQGHTYYYKGPTNVGVVRYKNGMALLVDAGIDSTAARMIAQSVEEDGLKPKYLVVTHAHPDHFGGAKWLKEQYTGLLRYAAEGEALGMKYPHLESQALFGAQPLRELEGRALKGPAVEVDETVKPGEMDFGDKKFEIIPLPGHTYDQIGILTGDGVLFAGDSLFSEKIMDKYPFPFLLDIEAQFNTIDRLDQTAAEQVVLSHAEAAYSSVHQLCRANKSRIEEYLTRIKEWCGQPLSREDVAEQVIQQGGTEPGIGEYYMTYATVGAFLSYLSNRGELGKSVIGGKLYFYQE